MSQAVSWADDPVHVSALSAVNFNAISKRLVISVKDPPYGAKGDGTTDDYAAIKAAAAAINTAGGGVLVFPPGTYKIDQYKILTTPPVGGAVTAVTAATTSNGITDIIFQNCNGLQIVGHGAVISVKGNFNRPDNYTLSGFHFSTSEQVTPFAFVTCTNFELCGFEVNGHVDLMTRTGVTAEGNGHGITTQECSNYVFRNLHVHHFSVDGLSLGIDQTVPIVADKFVTLHNVRSLNNGRQALSVIQVRWAAISACEFSETGNTGTYGYHLPGAGVDVEPNYTSTDGSFAPDVKTGYITFTNCKFKNNIGSQFVAAYANRVQKVRLRDCELIAGTSTSTNPVILSVDDGVIEDSFIDTGGQYVFVSWSSPSNSSQRTLLRNCEIQSTDKMLVHTEPVPVTIEGCRFICTATAPRSTVTSIYIQAATRCVFRENYVFFPAVAYIATTAYDIAVLIQGVRLARDNFFETDMNPGGSQHFAVDYTGTTTVQAERYLSAGTGNTGFRPNFSSAWNNTYPYSLGYGSVGGSLILNDVDVATGSSNRVVMVQAMPSSGSWIKGDVAINANPAKSGKIGWTRLTTGSGNVLNTDWQPFGAIDP
jgi:hypothetical protein